MARGPVVKLLRRSVAVGNQDVVRCLEEMLAVAKDGRWKAVSIAAIDDDGCTHTMFSVREMRSALLGAIDYARHRILIQMDNED